MIFLFVLRYDKQPDMNEILAGVCVCMGVGSTVDAQHVGSNIVTVI